MGNTKEIGEKIEKWVGEFLLKKSFEILEYNYSVPHGEIDIIAIEDKELVFIEVKACHERDRDYFPEEKVTFSKITKLTKAAESWLQLHPEYEGGRFDVIAVNYHSEEGVKTLKHYRNAIEF